MSAELPQLELSIGALSRATGVPVETLRTWERRYGFPTPVPRTGAGHRRYPAHTVERVRLIVAALEHGHRPASAIRSDPEELAKALGLAPPTLARPARSDRTALKPVDADDETFLSEWIAFAHNFDGESLTRAFFSAKAQLGVLGFLDQRMGPFLREVGHRWAGGNLRVMHEHFVSERARHFLAETWGDLADGARGASIVCATPAGEMHVIGLHMAAAALALAGFNIVFLGANVPASEIASAVKSNASAHVALSVAEAYEPLRLQREIEQVVSQTPPEVSVLLGGAGASAPGGSPRIVCFNSLSGLHQWALAQASSPNQ